MADTGWVFPGSAVSGGGSGLDWSSVSAITTNNSLYAQCPGSDDLTDIIIGYNFGLSIPASAVATLIEYRFEAINDTASAPAQASLNDAFVYVDNAGSPTLSGDIDLPNTLSPSGDIDKLADTLYTMTGTPTGTWSAFTTSVMNATGFGVGIQFSYNAGGTSIVLIDYLQMRVTYDIVAASAGNFFAFFRKSGEVLDWLKPRKTWLGGLTPELARQKARDLIANRPTAFAS